MSILRALVLTVAIALSGCVAMYRPVPVAEYACLNTDVSFSVHYSWDPPHARLQLAGQVYELPLSATQNPRSTGYHFTNGAGLELYVRGETVTLTRPGERQLRCEREIIIIT